MSVLSVGSGETLWNTWAGAKAATADIDSRLGDADEAETLDEITRDALHALRVKFADEARASWSAMTPQQRHQAIRDFGGLPLGSLDLSTSTGLQGR